MSTNPATRTSSTTRVNTPLQFDANGLPIQPPAYYATDADLAKGIDDYIAKHYPTSPLVGMGSQFVASGRKYNVDPTLLVGIAEVESALGTYKPAANQHNPFGLGPGISYPTYQASFDKAASLAADLGSGHKTLSDFLGSWNYGPNAHKSDPNYASAVSRVMAAIGGHPMSTVTPGGTDVTGAPVDTGWGPSAVAALGNITGIFSAFLSIFSAIFSTRGLLFIIGAFLAIVALVILSKMATDKSGGITVA